MCDRRSGSLREVRELRKLPVPRQNSAPVHKCWRAQGRSSVPCRPHCGERKGKSLDGACHFEDWRSAFEHLVRIKRDGNGHCQNNNNEIEEHLDFRLGCHCHPPRFNLDPRRGALHAGAHQDLFHFSTDRVPWRAGVGKAEAGPESLEPPRNFFSAVACPEDATCELGSRVQMSALRPCLSRRNSSGI